MHVDKEDSALRTIGEVAEELSLPAHVLRFWETKFAQLKPKKRRGRHRYYRPEDIEKLKQIRHLLYEQGYTIKGAQKYLRTERKGGQPQQVDLFAYSPYADASTTLTRLYGGKITPNRTQTPEPPSSLPAETAEAFPAATTEETVRHRTALSEQEIARLKEMLQEIKQLKQLLRSEA